MNLMHLNEIYISEGLKQRLAEIELFPITFLIAPTGYGKTTAIRWWHGNKKQADKSAVFFHITVTNGILSEFWRRFCSVVKKQRPEVAEKLMGIGCPEDAAAIELIMELWEEEDDHETFFVIDDANLLPVDFLAETLPYLGQYLSEHVHFVFISRNMILTPYQRIKIGQSLLMLGEEELRMKDSDVQAYAALCGLTLTQEESAQLAAFSGGWISMVYVLFCSYARTGSRQYDAWEIEQLILEAMIEPLSPKEQKFITVMSATADFTVEQASFIWGSEDAKEMLEKLVEQNAFISRDVNGLYHYHNLLFRITSQRLKRLPAEEQAEIMVRLGDWHVRQGEFFDACAAYAAASAWDQFLTTVVTDRGNSFSGESQKCVREWQKECPEELLCKYPEALLTFALYAFSAGDIPEMLRLSVMLTDSLQNNIALSEEERDNYLGEIQLLLSFLKFNNICEMGHCHEIACGLMSRASYLVNTKSPWTFGAPSVLMLYHRDAGRLDEENADMKREMQHYYQITDNHGNGAEYAMAAETALMRGLFQEAEIIYFQTVRAAERKNQLSIRLAAEATAMHLDLYEGRFTEAKQRVETLRRTVTESGEFVLIPTVDMLEALLYAFLGKPALIPQWILGENAGQRVMRVVLPVFLTVQNQALLANGDCARLIARGEETIAICRGSHMPLCEIYAHIHLAGALCKMDRCMQAKTEWENAWRLAHEDGILLPFAEYAACVSDILGEYQDCPEMKQVLCLSEKLKASKEEILKKFFEQRPDYGLSEREFEVAQLASKRRTIREIAQELFLSENTVKWYLKTIYGKLGISSSARNKMKLLSEIFSDEISE